MFSQFSSTAALNMHVVSSVSLLENGTEWKVGGRDM